jgi:hypothetical protein
MLALSTSWQSGGTVTAEGMFAALKNLEISGIELSYRISEDFYREMQNPLKRSGLKVVSILPDRIQKEAGICFSFQAPKRRSVKMQFDLQQEVLNMRVKWELRRSYCIAGLWK